MEVNQANNGVFPKQKSEISAEGLEEIYRMNDTDLFQADKNQDYEKGLQILEQINKKITNPVYCLNRKKYYSCLTFYHNNLAYFQSMDGNLEDAQKSLTSCIDTFEFLKGFLSSREENVAHNIEMVKLLLQTCAVLSQNGFHPQAFRNAEKALNKLIETFRILKAICEEQIAFSYITPSSKHQLSKINKISFKSIVLPCSRNLLEELSYLPPIHKLLAEQKDHFDKIMSHIYNWRDNDNVNEKAIRKELEIGEISEKKSLLGLPQANLSLKRFNMGIMMTLTMMKSEVNCGFNKMILLSPEKIKELGLYASVCYFTTATEGRFTEIEEDMESLSIVEKYEKLSKNEQIHNCRILHLKAMQIAGKIAPQAHGYFAHLMKSFNKNYKPVLDQIKQQSSIMSLFTACDQASMEYGIGVESSSKLSKKGKGEKTKTKAKSKISVILKKYGMRNQ